MKKYFITIILSLSIGFLLSYYLISKYSDAVIPTFLNGENVYLVEQGVYLNYDNMINNTASLDNYVYHIENELYHVYLGMSLTKENATKIQEIYEFSTNVKTISMNNNFLDTIRTIDSIISSTDDKETIKEACNQLLIKYKEE